MCERCDADRQTERVERGGREERERKREREREREREGKRERRRGGGGSKRGRQILQM